MNNRLPLVLDTCAIRDWDFIEWLGRYHEKKIISPIVYMEFSLHMQKRGVEQHKIKKLLDKAGVEITTFDYHAAETAALFMKETGDIYYCDQCGNTNWNDCLIAAHAPLPPYIFVTKNVKDFFSLLGEKRVKTPGDLMYPGRATEKY